MRTIRTILVPVAFLIWTAHAEGELASVSGGDIRFGIDTALFDYTGTDTLGLEIYQQISLEQLSMDQDSSTSFATTVVLLNGAGDTVGVDQWNSRTDWSAGRSIVNSTVLPVTPGEYRLDVIVTDYGNGKQGTLSRTLSVSPLFSLSEIELAKAIVPAPDGSVNPLLKGSMLVYPAADGSFMLPGEHMAYYYVELYDLGGTAVQMQGRLENASGETLFARPRTTVSIPEGAESVGLVDSLDIRAARTSGLHALVYEIIAGPDTIRTVKYLMIGQEETDPSETFEGTVEVADIPYPDQFRLILSGSERDIFDGLDRDAQSRFYEFYWQASPEMRQAFEDRCAYAGRYASVQRESWETDRGRVYIIYGPPDDIETVLLQGEQVPYETWYYYQGGNESFVFADLSGTGQFEQVYSSVEGEVSYSNWRDMITPFAGYGGNQ